MGKKYTTNFLEDTNGSTGSSNQVLISTPSGIDWVDGSGSSIIGGPYLPLSAGTSYPLTGALYVEAHLILQQDGGNDLIKSTGSVLYHKANEYSFQDNSNNSWVTIKSGNIGIGTTSPTNGKLVIDSTANQIAVETGTAGDGRLNIGHFSNGTFIGTYGDDGGAADLIRFGTHSGDERMRITAGGNVGIGTTTPTAPLHIEGGTNSEVLKIEADASPYIRWVENGTNVGFLQFLGDNAYLSNMSNGSFFFRTNNTDKMTILAGGNVGIGNTDPQQKLHIVSTDGANIILNSNTGAENNGIWMTEGGVATPYVNGAYVHYDSTNNVFKINTGTSTLSTRFEITRDTGAVKFNAYDSTNNTGTPTYLLGTDASGNIVKTNTVPGSGAGPYLPLSAGSSYPLTGALHTNGTIFMSAGNPGIIMQETDVTDKNWDIQVNGGNLKFYEVNDARSVFSEKVTFKAGGNVGIGTTSPTSPLEISGAGSDGNAILRLNSTAGGNTFNWISSTVYPNLLAGRTIINLFGKAQSTNNQAYIGFKYAGSGYTSNTLTLGFYANDFLVNILASGNVGIGTTAPGVKLEVNSGGSDSVARFTSTDARARILISDNNDISYFGTYIGTTFLGPDDTPSGNTINVLSNGNVGIGTTSPGYKLEVGLTSSVALASQPAIPLMISNDGNSVDGRVLLPSKARRSKYSRRYSSWLSNDSRSCYIRNCFLL